MVREKKTSRMAEFEKYAEGRHHFVVIAMIGAAASAILSVVPFYYIWLIINEALGDCDTDMMIGYGWMALIFALLSLLVYIAALMMSHLAAFRISKNLKKTMITHVMTLSPGALDEEGSGKVRRIIQDSVESTHTYIAHNQPDLASTFALPVAIIALLLIFDWRFALASLIPVVLGIYMAVGMLGREKLKESTIQWQNAMEDVNNKAVEFVRGISVVKVFQQTVDSFQSLKGSIDRYSDFCQDYTKMARPHMSGMFTLINSCGAFIIAMAVVIIEFFDNGTVSNDLIVNVIFYLTFTPIISVLMMRILSLSDQTYKVDDAIARVNNLLSLKPLEEPAVPEKTEEYTISFKNVRFAYSEEAVPAVDGVTLEMKQGTVTALVGPSGSGKSTMAGLAARFWDPQEGTILIGGKDLKNIGSKNIRSFESYVFQNNHLIKGTLLDNVRLGKPDATQEEVTEALRQAQCDDIVGKMPQGLDTLIGPGGVYLSGGEVQRVSIARAILRNAPIVILDEATAFADPENEHLIQKAFEELAKGRTVLLIAHRLTTVRNADLICVMDHGRIIESGKHDELVSRSGKYCSMWEDYQKALSWKVKGASA
jgi:ATP-binding cassette subfamily B protein